MENEKKNIFEKFEIISDDKKEKAKDILKDVGKDKVIHKEIINSENACETCHITNKSKLICCTVCHKYKCKDCALKESITFSPNPLMQKKIIPSLYVCLNCMGSPSESTMLSCKRRRNSEMNPNFNYNNNDDCYQNYYSDDNINADSNWNKRKSASKKSTSGNTIIYKTGGNKDLSSKYNEILKSYINKIDNNKNNKQLLCPSCNMMKQEILCFKTFFDFLFYSKYLYDNMMLETKPNLEMSENYVHQEMLKIIVNDFNSFFEYNNPITNQNKDFKLQQDVNICKDCLKKKLRTGIQFLLNLQATKKFSFIPENNNNNLIGNIYEEIYKNIKSFQNPFSFHKNFFSILYSKISTIKEDLLKNKIKEEFYIKRLIDSVKTNLDNEGKEILLSLQKQNKLTEELLTSLNEHITILKRNTDSFLEQAEIYFGSKASEGKNLINSHLLSNNNNTLRNISNINNNTNINPIDLFQQLNSSPQLGPENDSLIQLINQYQGTNLNGVVSPNLQGSIKNTNTNLLEYNSRNPPTNTPPLQTQENASTFQPSIQGPTLPWLFNVNPMFPFQKPLITQPNPFQGFNSLQLNPQTGSVNSFLGNIDPNILATYLYFVNGGNMMGQNIFGSQNPANTLGALSNLMNISDLGGIPPLPKPGIDFGLPSIGLGYPPINNSGVSASNINNGNYLFQKK